MTPVEIVLEITEYERNLAQTLVDANQLSNEMATVREQLLGTHNTVVRQDLAESFVNLRKQYAARSRSANDLIQQINQLEDDLDDALEAESAPVGKAQA